MRARIARSAVLSGLAVCCVLLLGCSAAKSPAEAPPKTWWLNDLAMFSNPRVTVTDEDEKPLARFSTGTLRELSQVKIGITEASGLFSELVLVEGAEPDAFAGFIEPGIWGIPAGTPVIVLSLGLVELLGRDSDAAAYLIGHETAHLLKGHAEAQDTVNVLLRRVRVLTEAGGGSPSRPLTDSAPFAVVRVVIRYTEVQENEAHAAGQRYATAAGYQVAGAERLARMLNAAPAGRAAPFVNRHPRTSGDPRHERSMR